MPTARRLATLALLLAAVPAGAAHAAPGVQDRAFRVSIEGTQKTTWSEHTVPQSRCDQGVTGSGQEVATFRTPRSYRLPVQRIGGKYVVIGDEHGNHVFASTKYERKAQRTFTPLDPTCQGTGGGGTIPPDCGTHRGSFQLGLTWNVTGGEGIQVQSESHWDAFKNCPLIGTGMPYLLDIDTKIKPIVARIPAKDLFDRSIGKHIVIARGKRTVKSATSSWTTRIRYEITLKRAK